MKELSGPLRDLFVQANVEYNGMLCEPPSISIIIFLTFPTTRTLSFVNSHVHLIPALPDDTPLVDLGLLAGFDFKKLGSMRKEGESVVREIIQELLTSFSHLEVVMLPEEPAQQLLVGVGVSGYLSPLTRVSPRVLSLVSQPQLSQLLTSHHPFFFF